MTRRRAGTLLLAAALAASCAPARRPPAPEAAPPAPPAPPANVDFFIRGAANPLWFEIAAGGLRRIDSPAEAGAPEFEPWAFMPHVTGMIADGGELVLAVNRTGFVTIFPWESAGEELIAVCKVQGGAGFSGGLASAPFLFEKTAAVVIQNSDYWTEKAPPLLEKRIWVRGADGGAARPVESPVFAAFEGAGGWEIGLFGIDTAGDWFFSARRFTPGTEERRYYRAPFPQEASPQEISQGAFQAEAEGAPFDALPEPLKTALGRLEERVPLGDAALWASRESSGAVTLYRRGAGEEVSEIWGFYEEGPRPRSLIITNRGLYAVNERVAELPGLPADFTWTAAGFCGNMIIAAWEERDTWRIGASGIAVWEYAP